MSNNIIDFQEYVDKNIISSVSKKDIICDKILDFKNKLINKICSFFNIIKVNIFIIIEFLIIDFFIISEIKIEFFPIIMIFISSFYLIDETKDKVLNYIENSII